ncbi:hypothetical protein NDU88_002118 [Pleurodeles waltl]|uniref:Uncharacterized protein n=1 Tax=Pleurodeles waltl TaxID=8319 RepID=A0AAV7VBN3_PLEWA|nr:hypothetical protein NDU88_002118 [Pleurodeles waltl]
MTLSHYKHGLRVQGSSQDTSQDEDGLLSLSLLTPELYVGSRLGGTLCPALSLDSRIEDAPGKNTGRPTSRQLLFSEALLHPHSLATVRGELATGLIETPADSAQDSTSEHILQQIRAVGHQMEGIDSNIFALTAETKSIRLDIMGFQNRMMGLEQCVTEMEECLNTLQE